MKNVICQIEHHAVLYGLLAREAIRSGEKEAAAMERATIEYGKNRGKRMASYARKEGIVPRAETYPVFKEWRALPGEMGAGKSEDKPRYTTRVTKCEWVNSWKKHDLLEYGKMYCVHIDKALYESYQEPTKCLLTVRGIQSAGDSSCIFDWGYMRSEETAEVIAEKQREIDTKYVKDFNFHTANLLSVVSEVLLKALGEKGKELCRNAWTCFGDMFGKEYQDAVLKEAAKQNWNISFMK